MRYYDEKIFVDCYNQVIEGLKETFKRKNHDYGSSTVSVYEDYKDSYIVRISDKYNRARNLTKIGLERAKVDEKLEDTILDMANYCILWLANIQYDKISKRNMVSCEVNETKSTTECVPSDLKIILDKLDTIKAGDDVEHKD